MTEINLTYQPVLHSDGSVAIHEILIDKDGTVRAATYEPVRLEASSIGELEALMRQVYRHMRKHSPITEDELEAMMYGVEDCTLDDNDNVINLIDYFAGQR